MRANRMPRAAAGWGLPHARRGPILWEEAAPAPPPPAPLRMRRSRLAPLLLLGLVAACAPAPAAAPRAPLRVLLYNIHAGKDAAGVRSLEGVARVVRDARADLVLLQEVDRGTERSGGEDQVATLERLTGLHGAFGRTLDYQGGEYGIAVLSRWPIAADTLHPLPVRPPQERAGGSHEPRGALHAVVAAPGGPIHLLNTHLDASRDDAYRLQEAPRVHALAERLRAGGALVLAGGDLNTTPGTPTLAALAAGGWRDAWAVCGRGDGFSFPAEHPVRRIDFLLLPPGAGCRSAAVLDALASDHRPVLFVLDRPRGSG